MSDTWNYRGPLDPDEVPTEWVWERLRMQRNTLLQQSDWRVLVDAPGDTSAWVTYRQALRDLPAATTDPRQAAWPVEPS